jgi:hypothetical protein
VFESGDDSPRSFAPLEQAAQRNAPVSSIHITQMV